jgi:hypothetical protein
MYKKFKKLSTLVRFIMLIIPVVGWVTEAVIRWEIALKKTNLFNVLVAIIFTFGGLLLQYVDLVYNLLTGKLLLID